MAKSADAFRTISEVADWLETPAHVLRFWESKFSQVKPVKRAGGRRYYRPADMKLLGGIKKLLHDDGMTIKGVQKMLREQGVKHVADLSQPLGDAADDVVIEATPQAARDATPRPTRDTAPAPADDASPADTEAPPEPKADRAPTKSALSPVLPSFQRHREEPAEAEPDPAPPEPAAAEPEQASEAPAFFRAAGGQTAAEEATPDDSSTDRAEDAAEPPAPPAPKPAQVSVPDDPPDTIEADPGVLARLARLPHPLPPALAEQLRPLVEKLRAASGAGRQG